MNWGDLAGRVCALSLFAALTLSSAAAQDLVYTPTNPSFGGNPFNSSHLLAVANAQNDNEAPSDARNAQADLFVRQLQSRLLSGLASEVTDAIFGENPQDFGRIVFGDQTIEFVRNLDSVTLTIFDATTGTTTVIEVPLYVVE